MSADVRRLVADLRAALDAALPAPWEADDDRDVIADSGHVVASYVRPPDAAAIVALRNLTPALLDRLERVAALADYWDEHPIEVVLGGVNYAVTGLRAALAGDDEEEQA